MNRMWNWILENVLDRRTSISKLTKADELVISNASLKEIKRGINKIYNEVYGTKSQCQNLNTVWTKYRIEFGSSELSLAYLGDTIEELHHAIDTDKRLDSDAELRRLLKEGWFGEFKDGNYVTQEYVIDNCMHFMWTVR